MAQPSGAAQQEPVDAALDSAVHSYFETQESEDVAGYLALWSSTATRPTPAMLTFIFDSGDDRFSDITIVRVTPTADGARVRVGAVRGTYGHDRRATTRRRCEAA